MVGILKDYNTSLQEVNSMSTVTVTKKNDQRLELASRKICYWSILNRLGRAQARHPDTIAAAGVGGFAEFVQSTTDPVLREEKLCVCTSS